MFISQPNPLRIHPTATFAHSRRWAIFALLSSTLVFGACQTTQNPGALAADPEEPYGEAASSEDESREGVQRQQGAPSTSPQTEQRTATKAKPTPSRPTEAAKITATPTAVGSDVEPAADIVALLAPRAKIVSARANRVVGKTSGPMKRGKPESTLGNFVTDAMRTGTEAVAGIPLDMCFTNSGGLRTDLDGGEITEGMVVELMPFDNAIVVLKMNGDRLEELARKVAQRGDPVSGLRYRRRGRKVSALEVAGAPLDPSRKYTICTNDYVYEGGSKYGLDDVKDAHYTGILIREAILRAFEEAYKKGETIEPHLDGRVKEG